MEVISFKGDRDELEYFSSEAGLTKSEFIRQAIGTYASSLGLTKQEEERARQVEVREYWTIEGLTEYLFNYGLSKGLKVIKDYQVKLDGRTLTLPLALPEWNTGIIPALKDDEVLDKRWNAVSSATGWEIHIAIPGHKVDSLNEVRYYLDKYSEYEASEGKSSVYL